MPATALPVLIAGAGIGGLALARALARRGLPFLVLEQAPALGEIGAGLTLWPNALRALARVGLDGAVLAAGERLTRAEVLSARGRVLMALDLAALERELGAPSVALHRTALQRVLLEGLPPEALRLGARVPAVPPTGSSSRTWTTTPTRGPEPRDPPSGVRASPPSSRPRSSGWRRTSS
jgi:2-polyprenyl-6-methoxyphenol hydroxylase-like FAD-dependent oxidoreductase